MFPSLIQHNCLLYLTLLMGLIIHQLLEEPRKVILLPFLFPFISLSILDIIMIYFATLTYKFIVLCPDSAALK